jgi:DNA-binding winged helix-turn-helix (wHTH) protein
VTASFAFERFVLDTADRRLTAGDGPVEINGRYLDALSLLVRESGRLVSKDRFMAEVWNGIPVTDEALTQCIRTLRRQLGDDAARPRFIETVPKHGYRFIAPVTAVDTAPPARIVDTGDGWRRFVAIGVAGTMGGGIAGAVGGLIYGFAATAQPGVGAISVLLVLLVITTIVALIGGAGVSFAIATAELPGTRSLPWFLIAGAGGGLLVGAFAKLLGLDAFNLLIGHSPGGVTGAKEGMLIGGAAGLAAWLTASSRSLRVTAATGGILGAIAGVSIALLRGKLMLGSLELLSRDFHESRLRVDQVGSLFGETGFGPVTRIVSAGLEGGLFVSCLVGAILIARRRLGPERD